MGYDMSWVRPAPPDAQAKAKDAYAAFLVACDARDAIDAGTEAGAAARAVAQEEVARAMNESQAAKVDYFRLNIGGMSAAREQLIPFGVIALVDNEHPLPYYDDKYLSVRDNEMYLRWDDVDQCYRDEDGERAEPMGLYREYLDAVREWSDGTASGDTAGIPIYKLGSNDGWLVTPGEIRTGLGWAAAHHGEDWTKDLAPYVAEFVTWMAAAAEYGGGFRVW